MINCFTLTILSEMVNGHRIVEDILAQICKTLVKSLRVHTGKFQEASHLSHLFLRLFYRSPEDFRLSGYSLDSLDQAVLPPFPRDLLPLGVVLTFCPL